MSWNVNLIGKPQNLRLALENQKTKLDGQSRVEFESVLPALLGLVGENFSKPESGYVEPVLWLEASGTGLARDGEQLHRSITVKLQPFYVTLV